VDVFVDHLSAAAAYLGLSVEQLRERLHDGQTLADVAEAEGKAIDGLKQAIVNDAREELDRAVSEGALTRERADAILQRLEARIDDFVNGASRDWPGRGLHGFGLFGFGGHFSAAAAYLGLSGGELRERLGDGQSLADVAEAEDKSVDGLEEAIVADAEKELDEAVRGGRLTQEEADAILERLQAGIDKLVNHSFRIWRGGGRFFDVEPAVGPLWGANA
jgi:hypothetical protein